MRVANDLRRRIPPRRARESTNEDGVAMRRAPCQPQRLSFFCAVANVTEAAEGERTLVSFGEVDDAQAKHPTGDVQCGARLVDGMLKRGPHQRGHGEQRSGRERSIIGDGRFWFWRNIVRNAIDWR
jgi:hypothetical protein